MLRRVVFLACSVALLACVLATPSTAQTLDKRTLFTFSGPVSMPGVTLPAGSYLFRLADPHSGRNVVQVLNADGTKPYGMFFAVRAERFDPAPAPEVRFMETATGTPAAIKTWWYPGERSGYEFVYPKEQARRLAQGASLPVLTTQTQTTMTEQTNTADLTRISSAGQETNVSADATPTASTPGGTSQQGEIASSSVSIANATIPARIDASQVATTSQPAQRTRASLPQTASMMPVVALVGCLALFAGIGLWAWRRNQA
jgi:LPXTG-motif cell wall-anchored protein